jgi:hypothetical protein
LRHKQLTLGWHSCVSDTKDTFRWFVAYKDSLFN